MNVNIELKMMNDCLSDWIPTFLLEGTEESFEIPTKNLINTFAEVGMTKSK